MAGLTDPLAAAAEAARLSEAGDPAAVDAWRAVVGDNPEHGTHWCRLAMAYSDAGRPGEALPAYRQALRLGVFGAPPVPTDAGELHHRIARCHAALGEPDAAVAALREGLTAGLRNPGRLADDEQLAPLRGHPWFAALVRRWQPPPEGAGEPSTVERDTGWRTDLAVLVEEIARRSPNYPPAALRLAELVTGLDRDIPQLTDLQVLIGFWRLLRQLRDGHARLRAERVRPQWHVSLPVWFGQFAEGVYVTEVDPAHPQLLGARLLAVDDRPVADVLAALDPLLTRDNDYWASATGPLWLRRTAFLHALGVLDRPDAARLRVRTADGGERTVHLPAQPVAPDALPHTPPPPDALRLPGPAGAPHLRQRQRPYWFTEYPADQLVFLQYNSILDDPGQPWAPFLASLFERVDRPGVAHLVVDLRHNGGGNTFLAAQLLVEILRRERINRPRGLFVIVGRVTFSAAQNLATMLERYSEAVFVGEPTGSSPNFVGETVPFRLPYSGIEANISDLVWQTSWPMDRRVAVVPELAAPPTFADFAAGHDAALERILTLLRGAAS